MVTVGTDQVEHVDAGFLVFSCGVGAFYLPVVNVDGGEGHLTVHNEVFVGEVIDEGFNGVPG